LIDGHYEPSEWIFLCGQFLVRWNVTADLDYKRTIEEVGNQSFDPSLFDVCQGTMPGRVAGDLSPISGVTG
jgi:hypothetical protein